METYLYFAAAAALGRDADIDLTDLSHALFDAITAVAFEFHQLPIHYYKCSHHDATAQDGCHGEHEAVLYHAAQANTAPSDAQQEVHRVANRKELYGSAGVHRIAVAISKVGTTSIEVTYVSTCIGISKTEQRQSHLDKENDGGSNSYRPISTHVGRQSLKPIDKCCHHSSHN